MNIAEQDAVSEVSRVVDNYNEILIAASNYDGSGTITMGSLPDDPEDLIDAVVLSMQKTKLNLEKAGKKSIAKEVNTCVNQVHDAKELLV